MGKSRIEELAEEYASQFWVRAMARGPKEVAEESHHDGACSLLREAQAMAFDMEDDLRKFVDLRDLEALFAPKD